MEEVKITTIKPRFVRDNGLYIVDLIHLEKQLGYNVVVRQAVSIPPGGSGGNHRHPRRETFVCLDKGIELHWIDSRGERRSRSIESSAKQVLLGTVHPNIPHALKNTSGEAITVIELANAEQYDVTPMDV